MQTFKHRGVKLRNYKVKPMDCSYAFATFECKLKGFLCY